MQRFAITYLAKNKMRKLVHPNQGRYFSDTEEDANKQLETMLRSNTQAQFADVFGEQAVGTFEVRPVECYDSGDAKSIYFDT